MAYNGQQLYTETDNNVICALFLSQTSQYFVLNSMVAIDFFGDRRGKDVPNVAFLSITDTEEDR